MFGVVCLAQVAYHEAASATSLSGGDMVKGCLLIHGFGGAPFEMEPLAARLAAAGHMVRNITLPGHDTSFEDFRTTYFMDWAAYAEAQYRELAHEVDGVVPIGLSMGGALALYLAEVFTPLAVVALAAPMYVYRYFPLEMQDWRLPLVGLVKRRWPVLAKAPRSPEAKALVPWRGYEGQMALPQLHSLLQGIAGVKRRLHEVTAPLLVMHARGDKTVPVGNAFLIGERVRSSQVTVRVFDINENRAGKHLITCHPECGPMVGDAVVSFVNGLK